MQIIKLTKLVGKYSSNGWIIHLLSEKDEIDPLFSHAKKTEHANLWTKGCDHERGLEELSNKFWILRLEIGHLTSECQI
jgi:hypothetical protein